MLIHNVFSLVAVFYIIWSFVNLCWSAVNKKKSYSIMLCIISIVGPVYLYSVLDMLPDMLDTGTGSKWFESFLLAMLASVFYAISLIINLVKWIKHSEEEVTDREKIRNIFTVSGMVIIPALVISLITVQDYYRIRNSDAIVIILSRRETEDIWDFLDNESFGYVIMGDKVKRFDLMLHGNIEKILDDDMIKADGTDGEFKNEPGEYRVIVRDEYIRIMHGDDLIYEYDPSLGNYFNNEVLESYYRKRK